MKNPDAEITIQAQWEQEIPQVEWIEYDRYLDAVQVIHFQLDECLKIVSTLRNKPLSEFEYIHTALAKLVEIYEYIHTQNMKHRVCCPARLNQYVDVLSNIRITLNRIAKTASSETINVQQSALLTQISEIVNQLFPQLKETYEIVKNIDSNLRAYKKSEFETNLQSEQPKYKFAKVPKDYPVRPLIMLIIPTDLVAKGKFAD